MTPETLSSLTIIIVCVICYCLGWLSHYVAEKLKERTEEWDF